MASLGLLLFVTSVLSVAFDSQRLFFVRKVFNQQRPHNKTLSMALCYFIKNRSRAGLWSELSRQMGNTKCVLDENRLRGQVTNHLRNKKGRNWESRRDRILRASGDSCNNVLEILQNKFPRHPIGVGDSWHAPGLYQVL